MKKYSKKSNVCISPNFSSEINGFVEKLDVLSADDKKVFSKILELHFKNLQSFGVDMWELKQRLDESMQQVVVEFKNSVDDYAWGLYYSQENVMQILKRNAKANAYFATILHELTHCLSSSRQNVVTKGKNLDDFLGKRYMIAGTSYSNYVQTEDGVYYECGKCSVLTEAITEYLTNFTMAKYYGVTVPKAYFNEQKVLNQARLIFGNDIIKSYFEGDTTIFEPYLKPFEGELANIITITPPCSGLNNYFYLLDRIFDNKSNVILQNNMMDINSAHLMMFQNKIIKDLFDNADAFSDGQSVKQAVLNAYTMYGSSVFMGFVNNVDGRLFYDFWNLFCDCIECTLDMANVIFTTKKNMTVPKITDRQLLNYLQYAQNLSFKNYRNVFPHFYELNVHDLQNVDVKKYLLKDLDVQSKWMKDLKNVLFADLTEVYFDENQYYGTNIYEEAYNQSKLIDSYQGFEEQKK